MESVEQGLAGGDVALAASDQHDSRRRTQREQRDARRQSAAPLVKQREAVEAQDRRRGKGRRCRLERRDEGTCCCVPREGGGVEDGASCAHQQRRRRLKRRRAVIVGVSVSGALPAGLPGLRCGQPGHHQQRGEVEREQRRAARCKGRVVLPSRAGRRVCNQKLCNRCHSRAAREYGLSSAGKVVRQGAASHQRRARHHRGGKLQAERQQEVLSQRRTDCGPADKAEGKRQRQRQRNDGSKQQHVHLCLAGSADDERSRPPVDTGESNSGGGRRSCKQQREGHGERVWQQTGAGG
mmetsp:Transcript_16554/g.49034  ORF Transcript_16554/g.49034 Transcript_16554/m.49034 type:complete len:295 (+) Transcript_16554:4449-5333(+)